jgi:hypothetical protein
MLRHALRQLAGKSVLDSACCVYSGGVVVGAVAGTVCGIVLEQHDAYTEAAECPVSEWALHHVAVVTSKAVLGAFLGAAWPILAPVILVDKARKLTRANGIVP